MVPTEDDTKSFTIEVVGAEEPEKKTPWVLYLILAGIAAALLG